MKTRSLALFICNVSIIAMVLVPFTFMVNIPEARAAAVDVSCTGSAGSPTAVDEVSLSGDDVTFSDGGDGYCALDASISAASILIEAGVVLTHTAEDSDGVTVTTTGNFEIESGASIDVDAKGCAGAPNAADGFGPDTSGDGSCTQGAAYGGAGDYVASNGAGGGYGGSGGDGQSSVGGSTYGSGTAPTYLGSGGSGSAFNEYGGAGGGLVILNVTGTLTIDGSITADGGDGEDGGYTGGGGSGGAVNITTGTLAGSGTITADGGDGGDSGGWGSPGGGGGRIAVNFNTNSMTLTGIVAPKGSMGVGSTQATEASAGTTFIVDQTNDDLYVTTRLNLLSGGDYTRRNITFYNGALVDCGTANYTTLNLGATGTLDMQGVTWTCSTVSNVNISAASWTTSNTNAVSITREGSQVDWAITNDLTLNNLTYTGASPGTASEDGGLLTCNDAINVSLVNTDINSSVDFDLTTLNIDSDSSISATGKGCSGGQTGDGYGPNTASSNECILGDQYAGAGEYTNYNGAGGGHGGTGGNANNGTSAGGSTYGSDTNPVLLGSGGAGGQHSSDLGGAGGGKLFIDTTGTLTINGSIDANGGAGSQQSYGGGGGSGGSVNITTVTLAGSGSIAADGGVGGGSGTWAGAGGGGGHVAVTYGVATFNTSNITAALGAKGTSSTTATDGAIGTESLVDQGPSISSAATGDTDSDGYIDAVVLTMTEDVSAGQLGYPDTIAGADFTSSDSYTVASASRTADSQITVVLTEKSTGDTDATPTITIAGSIDDLAANSTTSGSKAATDGAKPRITDINYSDADSDGKVDTLDLRFSENITDASVIRHADLLVSNDGDFDGLVFGSATTDLATGTRNNLEILLGTEATVVDTNEGSGNIEVVSQSSFSITDGTNTNSDTGAFAGVVYGDRAAPVISALAPEDAETNVSKSEDIVVTFSEPINTGTAAYTISPDADNKVNTWTVGNTVLTISHDDLDSFTDYTFTMTTATDAGATALGGSVDGVTHPATFTTASSGGVSVSSSAPDPDISHTDDEGNALDSISESSNAAGSGTCETGLNPGEDIALSWSSNSSVNLVNLYYSTDAGTSYTLIEGPITNTENYSWTIPADITGSTLQFKIEGTDLAEITATFETESCVLNGADDGTESDDTTDAEDSTSEVTEPTTGETGYSPVTGELEDISVVNAGDYIRSSYFSTVYYIQADGDDLVRRPFMNAQTFFTYQDDFSSVKTVTDATLSTIDLGQPMLPNPGVVLIKIQSDPKVYAIDTDGVTIRWITTEDIATTLYGDNWNEYIIDIEATFFPRFTQGEDIEQPDDFTSAGKSMKTRQELSR